MKRISIILLVGLLLNSCFSPKGLPIKKVSELTYNSQQEISNVIDHSSWTSLLKLHVNEEGLVNYKGFKEDQDLLDAYVAFLSKQIPTKSWSTQEQLAYFINCYNANTIKLIIDNYPIKSIKDVSATISPFLKSFIFIGEKSYSLADLEKGILQKMNEPRIHFAINCASYSCPKLMTEAYTAQNVNDLMNAAARSFVNSDKNTISKESVSISQIFKWYKSDFLKESPSIVDYINKFSDIPVNADAIISYLDYDWNLNEMQ